MLKNIEARCTNYPFCSDSEKGYGVFKNVPLHTIDCPDCGHALVWIPRETKPHRQNAEYSFSKKKSTNFYRFR